MQGPVDKVEPENGRLTVLGKSYSTGLGRQQLKRLANQVASGVSVAGAIIETLNSPSGTRGKAFVLLPSPYVAGVSKVAIVGRVLRVRADVGSAMIDGVEIDYTPLLSSHDVTLAQGERVLVIGVQAASGAPIQALSLSKVE